MPELIESSRFVSHRARMTREFDAKKDSELSKFKQRPQIFVKQIFRGLCSSKLSGIYAFDKIAIIH